MVLKAGIWALRLGSESEGGYRRGIRRRTKKSPICVIDPFGAAAQKGRKQTLQMWNEGMKERMDGRTESKN